MGRAMSSPTPSPRPDLRRLAIPVPLLPEESGLSFVQRSFKANGVGFAQGMHWLGLDRRRPINRQQLLATAWALNVDGATLASRWPLLESGGLPGWVHLAGHRFCRWLAPTKPLARLCPACLREQRAAHLLWQLRCVMLCPLHAVPLETACPACKQAIAWDRPDIDVCRCGRYLRAVAAADDGTDDSALGWHRWVAGQMLGEDGSPALPSPALPALIDGLSVDGAFRLIDAFGVFAGKVGSVRAARQQGSSVGAQLAVLRRGIDRLRRLEQDLSPGGEIFDEVHLDALHALARDPATPADGLRAAWLLEFQRGQRPPGRVGARPRQQLPLFL